MWVEQLIFFLCCDIPYKLAYYFHDMSQLQIMKTLITDPGVKIYDPLILYQVINLHNNKTLETINTLPTCGMIHVNITPPSVIRVNQIDYSGSDTYSYCDVIIVLRK